MSVTKSSAECDCFAENIIFAQTTGAKKIESDWCEIEAEARFAKKLLPKYENTKIQKLIDVKLLRGQIWEQLFQSLFFLQLSWVEQILK